MFQAIRECGFWGYVALFLGFLGTAIGVGAVVAFALAKRRVALTLGVFALLAAMFSFGAGAAGRQLGRATVESILPLVAPDQAERLREAGYAEADQCVSVGGGAGALPVLLGLLGVLSGIASRKMPAG